MLLCNKISWNFIYVGRVHFRNRLYVYRLQHCTVLNIDPFVTAIPSLQPWRRVDTISRPIAFWKNLLSRVSNRDPFSLLCSICLNYRQKVNIRSNTLVYEFIPIFILGTLYGTFMFLSSATSMEILFRSKNIQRVSRRNRSYWQNWMISNDV